MPCRDRVKLLLDSLHLGEGSVRNRKLVIVRWNTNAAHLISSLRDQLLSYKQLILLGQQQVHLRKPILPGGHVFVLRSLLQLCVKRFLEGYIFFLVLALQNKHLHTVFFVSFSHR